MNDGLVRAIEVRRKLYRQYHRRGTLEARLKYETYNIRLRRILRRTNDDFYKAKIMGADGGAAEAWRYVNSYIRGKPSAGAIDPLLVNKNVQEINDFFPLLGPNTVLSKMQLPDPSHCLPPQRQCFFSDFQPPSIETVEAIECLGVRKVAGLDGIPSALIKRCSAVLSAPFHALSANIVTTSSYPAALETAPLFLVYKSSPVTNLEKYIPISLLSVINRVVERILSDQLYAELERCHVLASNQFGFRHGLSCEMAA